MQIGSPSKRQELGCGTESRSIPARNTEHDAGQQGTTSHGDVEDMELSDTTQVTGDH